MTIIILLISISLIIAVGFLLSFLWSMKAGQFDDTYSPAVRILLDDKKKPESRKKDNHGTQQLTSTPAEKV